MNQVVKRYFISTLALQLLAILSFSQIPTAWSFEILNSSHGLPSSEIISLAKDNEGFLWIGTSSGLSRYDGYVFHNYSHTRENELIGYVNVLILDDKNRLWIGSDAGLFCYANKTLTKISAPSALPQGVNDVLPSNDGILWLATENGPVQITVGEGDPASMQKIVLANYVLRQWPYKNASNDDRRLMHVAKAPDGTIYFSQRSKLYRLEKQEIQLLHSIENQRDNIFSLFPVSRSKIYFNTIVTEMHKVEEGVHTNIQHKQLYRPGFNHNAKGFWHLGTFGLYYFHPDTETASLFINTTGQAVIWSTMFLKEEHFFWLATHNGLLKIKPALFHIPDLAKVFTRHLDYYSIAELNSGVLLFGSNRGNVVQKTSSDFQWKYESIVPSAEVKDIYEDRHGRLWMATGYQGLVLVTEGGKQNFTEKEGLHDNSFSRFLETRNGRLFAIGDQGLSEVIETASGNFKFRAYYYSPNISKYAKFLAAKEAPDGTIWIAGEEGLVRLKDDTLQPVLINGKRFSIKDMDIDRQGNCWLATDGDGVLQCRLSEQGVTLLRQWTERDGLSTGHYLSLLVDSKNNIWVGSSRGITVIGQDLQYKGQVLNYDETDGFAPAGSYFMRLFQDSKDTIWVATSFGFISFDPRAVLLPVTHPMVYITSVRNTKNQQEIITADGSRGLAYNNNSLTFGFVAVDYANQKDMRYFYKLDGLDTSWINTGNIRSVSYENLPPGKYRFMVQALNNKGKISAADAVYAFSIKTPFWKTAWFILVVAALVVAVAGLLMKRRIATIRTKAAIEQQLGALEMKALRSQMNPHFIFNSLNSISQLVASKRNEEGLQYLSKFSKLLRLVLDESEKNVISLKDELRILDLYLQLESLRFGSSFSFTIHVDPALDEEETLLPPFLIHPIVENAVWHGLLHKEGERRLVINFQKQHDRLVCVVKDNGIGIDAAMEKKQQQLNGEKQASKGLKMVKERLALLGEQRHPGGSFRMEDLKDGDGMINGTRCTLEIPVVYE